MSGLPTLCQVQIRKRDGTSEERRAEATRRDTFYSCRVSLSEGETILSKRYEEDPLWVPPSHGPNVQEIRVDILRERCQNPA
jgi:hypothetical protein